MVQMETPATTTWTFDMLNLITGSWTETQDSVSFLAVLFPRENSSSSLL